MRSFFTKAGISLAALVAFALPAGLALQSASASTTQSKDIAGYQTSRWVRVESATFNLPTNTACAALLAPRSPAGDGFAITLGPAEESNAGVAYTANTAATTVGLSFVPSVSGCGLISPSFASNVPGYSSADQFPATSAFLPGNNVTISLYYNVAAHFTSGIVVDNTNGTALNTRFTSTAGPVTYKSGSATAGYGPFTPKGGSVKPWLAKNVDLKTYTGHSGSIGSFAAQAINMTSDGTSSGTLYSNPGSLWNSGANFPILAH
jgi:hypothetical protein